MFNLKIIKYFYIFLTVLILLTPLNVSILYFLPSLILLWLTYFVFKLSINNKLNKGNRETILLNSIYTNITPTKFVILLTVTLLIFMPLYIQFYTGSSLHESIKRFINGSSFGMHSNYYLYQEYFKQNNLDVFSINKLPYILALGVLKFLFWTTTLRLVGFSRKIPIVQILCIIIMFFTFILLGVSRGTSFESFELLILIAVSVLIRSKVLYNKSWLTGRLKFAIYILSFLAVLYFVISKSMRYGGEIIFTNPTSSLRYNPDSFISQNIPIIALITNNLSGYFVFGLYFSAVVINQIWLNNGIKGIILSLIPFGPQFSPDGNSYRDILCGKIIDCGASWIPDSMIFIYNLGLIIYFLLIFLLGKFFHICYNQVINGSIKHSISLLFIILFMFSLPVGNFITASSSIIIVLFINILSYIFPKIFKIYELKLIKI